eukprot:g14422.t1
MAARTKEASHQHQGSPSGRLGGPGTAARSRRPRIRRKLAARRPATRLAELGGPGMADLGRPLLGVTACGNGWPTAGDLFWANAWAMVSVRTPPDPSAKPLPKALGRTPPEPSAGPLPRLAFCQTPRSRALCRTPSRAFCWTPPEPSAGPLPSPLPDPSRTPLAALGAIREAQLSP